MSDAREATASSPSGQDPPSGRRSDQEPTPGAQDSSVPTKEASGSSPQGPIDRGGWTALSLGFAGLLLTFWLWPVGLLLGSGLDAAAIAVGARALRRSRQQRGHAPGARGGLVLGCVGLALGVVLGSFTAVFWNELQAYRQCMGGAITVEARADCDTRVREAIGERLGISPEELRLITLRGAIRQTGA